MTAFTIGDLTVTPLVLGEIMEGTAVCFAPVLSLGEAPSHPHNMARETFVEFDGQLHPAPAPRFRNVPNRPDRPAPKPGEHTEEVLGEWTSPAQHPLVARDNKQTRGEDVT